MESTEVLKRVIQQVQLEISIPRSLAHGPVAGEEYQLWKEFQRQLRLLCDQYENRITTAREEGREQGWDQGHALASQHCPECGQSAAEILDDFSDYACWGGPVHSSYKCSQGHGWEDAEKEQEQP